METLQALLVVMEVREQHLAFLAHQLLTLAAVAALQTQPLELAAQAAAGLALLEIVMERLVQPTQVAVVVDQEIAQVLVVMALLAAPVLSSCLSPQTNIRELPRVLRRSQQAGQTPS
jgi:hypothetical protein